MNTKTKQRAARLARQAKALHLAAAALLKDVQNVAAKPNAVRLNHINQPKDEGERKDITGDPGRRRRAVVLQSA